MSEQEDSAGQSLAEPATEHSGQEPDRTVVKPGSATPSGRPSGSGRAQKSATSRPAATRATGVANVDATADEDDDGDAWRHDPVAPVDEPNPLKSLGNAIADTVTGGEKAETKKPKR
jgi:hypothetical protein